MRSGDRVAWRLILAGYVPWLAVLSLAWELAHLPLYTLWREESAASIAFAVAHCTAGDVLIGIASLLLASIMLGETASWRTAALTAAFAVLYTALSEWMNVGLARWSYSELMPTLDFGAFRLGLSPLAQWLVIPPIALFAARRISP